MQRRETVEPSPVPVPAPQERGGPEGRGAEGKQMEKGVRSPT